MIKNKTEEFSTIGFILHNSVKNVTTMELANGHKERTDSGNKIDALLLQ